MNPHDPQAFPATRWSLVGRAGHPDAAVRQAALAELLRRYLPAFRAYLTHVRRIPADAADDLLQGFLVSKVLEEQLVAEARADRGRFRSFLLKALDRYLISEYRAAQRQKRQTDRAYPLGRAKNVAARDAGPADAFDVAWARELLAEALHRMQAECAQTRRPDVWGIFSERVLAEVRGEGPGLEYAELVRRYGLKSPAHAANLLITGKRMLARMLRIVVAEYEADETRIDEEIADLQRILARGP